MIWKLIFLLVFGAPHWNASIFEQISFCVAYYLFICFGVHWNMLDIIHVFCSGCSDWLEEKQLQREIHILESNVICCSSLLLFTVKNTLFWQQSKVSKMGSKYQFIDGNGFVRVPCLWNIEYRTSYFHNGSPVITFGNIPKHIISSFFISNIAFKIILERRLLWC